MDWLEQNLDAYRIIAEILEDLRETLRQQLDQTHGQEWYKAALPDGLLDRLVERKEEEKAIDWYESEYQQIMNYALFPDLLEIMEHNADIFPKILGLAPTSALLNARFLELEVMRAKLGRARPISETELSFLGTFHLRFRKAIEDHRTRAANAPASAATPPAEPAPTPPAAAPDDPAEPASVATAPPPVSPVTPPPPEPETTPSPTSPPEPRSAEPAVAEGTTPQPEEPASVESTGPETAPETAAENEEPAQDPKPVSFEEALEAGDSQVILRELYKEVTGIAEGIWTKDIPPPARIWEKVSTSSWYENNFSNLGLRPASDFYDVISKVDAKMRQGAKKEELQTFLKDLNFAQTLLALRDMFQKNHI